MTYKSFARDYKKFKTKVKLQNLVCVNMFINA